MTGRDYPDYRYTTLTDYLGEVHDMKHSLVLFLGQRVGLPSESLVMEQASAAALESSPDVGNVSNFLVSLIGTHR